MFGRELAANGRADEVRCPGQSALFTCWLVEFHRAVHGDLIHGAPGRGYPAFNAVGRSP